MHQKSFPYLVSTCRISPLWSGYLTLWRTLECSVTVKIMRENSRHSPPRLEIETRRIEWNLYRSWACPCLNSEDLEGTITDHGQISNGWLSNIDLSRTFIARENSTSTSTTYLIGKELMLRECRDWRQENKSTVILKTDFYEEKEG
jgi:hypothetical protein